MRYIRTEDGRIIKIGEQADAGFDKGTLEIHNKAGIAASYGPFEVLKEAGTIEELCDEFVIYDADIKRCHILDKGFYHRFDEECKKALHIANRYIYGAIYTDKGLIYVAKMNEKGEMELL